MSRIELFPREQIVGVFRGFREGGLEFHADLVLPYRSEFQRVPMHGQFVLVQLETPDEAVLGRIASLSSDGKLSYGAGEEFNIRAVQDNRPVPEDLREHYLRYRVNIRVLGVLRSETRGITFVASHRRLPHLGSPVAFPSDEVLKAIAGHSGSGAEIGHLALGEYVYAGDSPRLKREDWMQVRQPEVPVRFAVENLVSRRTFVFARAGFGKSNLNKLLFSRLYVQTPTTTKRGDVEVPVGTIIFDPDGEYFWPDDKGRPGLCDVPGLQDKLVVFTDKEGPSPFYGSFKAGGTKLDLRRFDAADVIGITVSAERQDQQNVRKLRGLPRDRWQDLVDLVYADGNQADPGRVSEILGIRRGELQSVEAVAATSNVTAVMNALHDPGSDLLDKLLRALRAGKICVVDISEMRGEQGLKLSALILRHIFNHNQREFTRASPSTIPTIAVIEEAQAVLNGASSASVPYVEWVKEGRKYDLGAVMVTQQPGSIPVEILSQGDNWFIFHLLSAADLMDVKRANAHFSDDILAALLNEPISGQGVFWSSASGMSYPIPLRVLSFEQMYPRLDERYTRDAVETFASELAAPSDELDPVLAQEAHREATAAGPDGRASSKPDRLRAAQESAIEALRRNQGLMNRLRTANGVPWWQIQQFISDQLEHTFDNPWDEAYPIVLMACNRIFGQGNWTKFSAHDHRGKNVPHIRASVQLPNGQGEDSAAVRQ